MQSSALSKKYLQRIIKDIYLDLNLLSSVPYNEHAKSVVNHIKDRVNLLDNFVSILIEYYENETNAPDNKEADNKD